MSDSPSSGPAASIPVSVGSIHDMLVTRMVDPPDAPGQLGRVDRYDLKEVIGEGGMGRVFAAVDRDTGKKVAVKMIRPELAGKPGHVRRFLNEARHMYDMDHPSVMKVLGVCNREGAPYFVMPYASGGSLADRVRRDGPMNPDDILYYSYQIARGLRYAHERGIIHRDLKTANALLASNGRAFLTDFGLSQTVFNDWVVDPKDARIEGTIPYMSPAVAEGKAEDTRCDIYAFGAMLYEMLTGSPPYLGKNPLNILKIIKMRPPRPITSRYPDADASLTAIAEAAMARELHDRYASMDDVIADLDRVADGQEPLGAHGHAAPPKAKRWPLVWRLALLMLTTVAALAAWLPRGPWLDRLRRSHSKPCPPLPVVVMEEEEDSPWPALLADADTAYGGAQFEEAIQLYDKALRGMARDSSTDSAALGASRRSAETRRDLAGFYVARRGMSLQRQVDATVAKLKELNPGCNDIFIRTDGQEIGNAFLAWCPLRNISPIMGLPIRRLDLAATRIENLAPLSDMPLTFLSLYATGISDLSSLSGFDLTGLHLNKTPVRDLAPLKDMPLNELFLSETPVREIGVLSSLPLTTLTLDGCTELHDLRPLARCKSLEKLVIPAHSKDIDFLRDLPNLAYLSTRFDRWQTTAEEFWRMYDARGGDTSVRSEAPVSTEAIPGRRLSDAVDLANAKVLVADDLNNPKRSAFGWGGWAGAYQHGRIGLHGSGAPAWGASNHNFMDFVCEVVARTSGGRHRGWGIAIWKGKDAGFEVLLDSDGRLSVVPCRWGRNRPELTPLDGLPIGPVETPTFRSDMDNEMTVVFREGRKLEVFVNGEEACEPVVFSKRIEPTILQLASVGGEEAESRLEFESYRVWQAVPAGGATDGAPAWQHHLQAGRVALAENRYRAAAEACQAAIDAMAADAASDATALATARHEAEVLRDLAAFIPARAELEPALRIEATKQKLQELNPDYRLNGQFELAEGHITRISLENCRVHDISSLRGLPLEDLNLRGTSVRDLGPLVGMPLARLSLWGVDEVTDIAPLTKLPLTWLDLELTSVKDLTPLSGHAIEHLSLARTPVADIAPMKGMPLKHLNLHKTIGVHDLEPLKGARLTSIYLSEVPVVSVEPLRGMKLETLWLEGTKVADIAPLSGMPLRTLFLSGTRVRDLSPLEGMPLEWLALDNMAIADLSPLHGMPLTRLRLGGSEKLADLSPLQECVTLEHLLFPPNAPASDFLRRLPKLKHLSYSDPGAWLTVTKSAEQFWREYDAGQRPGLGTGGKDGTPAPTEDDKARRLKAAGNLKQVWLWLRMYSGDHGKFPDDLGVLCDKKYGMPGRVFLVPGSGTAEPKSGDDIRKGLCDFLYFGREGDHGTMADQCVLVTKPGLFPGVEVSVARGKGQVMTYTKKLPDDVAALLAKAGVDAMHAGGADDVAKTGPPPDWLLGKWEMVGFEGEDMDDVASMTLQFADRGKLLLSGTSKQGKTEEHEGTYAVDGEKMVLGTDGKPQSLQYAIQDGDLVLSWPQGKLVLRRLGTENDATSAPNPQAQVDLLQGRLEKLNPGYDREKGQFEVRDGEVAVANLAKSDISDISPLAGLKLQRLDLAGCPVSDISALRGMPLEYLSVYQTKVTDLSVLRGMPLKEFHCGETRVTDLTPVNDLKQLETLNCWNMKVDDLSPLAGLHLKSLTLALCKKVIDIYPLSGMGLTSLNLWNSGVRDISPLRGMQLRHLDVGETAVHDVRVLKGMPLRGLVMCGTQVSDISVVKGMPLTYLRIDRTKVTDIGPIRGMQLPALGLPEGVTDIAPLAGMPLTYLHLIKCGVTDISVVRGLPLRELLLEDCPKLKDLTPIADCKTIEKLAVPKHCTDIDFLRKLPNLKHLNSDNDFKWEQTVDEFWRKWDERGEAGE